jgi:hypothetical protein
VSDALKDAAARVVVARQQLDQIGRNSPDADFPTWLRAMAAGKILVADTYEALHVAVRESDLDEDVRRALGVALIDAALWRRDWADEDNKAADNYVPADGSS